MDGIFIQFLISICLPIRTMHEYQKKIGAHDGRPLFQWASRRGHPGAILALQDSMNN